MSNMTTKTRPGQQTASFLVRFWQEPRERREDQPIVRGYLRNLGSGEEQYIRDPEQLGLHILRHLRREMAGETASSHNENDDDLKASSQK